MPTHAKTDTLEEFANSYSSVSMSPDGTAWTIKGTGSAERNEYGYQLKVGRDITLKTAGVGQHIYQDPVAGSVDISYWEVKHVNSQCVHGSQYVGDIFAGLLIEGDICGKFYDNGWFPVCADCGKYIMGNMVYAHSDQLKDINTMVGSAGYYYLCPFSGSLEQGIGYVHLCDDISSNRYIVQYIANAPAGELYGGSTTPTYHMYNNDTIYEGAPATYADTNLRKNGYYIPGYVFTGWNTEKDGSGTSFVDEQDVLNLTTENKGRVFLYAQWQKVETTLKIDANGGKYDGVNPFTVKKLYGSTYDLAQSRVTPPSGYTITFNTNGGTACSNKVTTKSFSHWEAQAGFEGILKGNRYYFNSQANGHIDIIKVQYIDDAITLPNTTKSNLSFAGWYYDSALTDFCGMPGDEVVFTKKTTLYAKWMPLTLYSEPIYSSTVNGGKGAVNLWWEQKDNNAKIYKLYQSLNKSTWNQVTNTGAVESVASVNQTFTYSSTGKTYTIPKTGYYEITAYGAKGADYSSDLTGGLGGKVTATYWLKEGDVITSYAGTSGSGKNGGQNGNGVNGGSSNVDSARGGGAASEVYVTRNGTKTLLLTAGGGGGANSMMDGGSGGENSTTTTTKTGASTDAGGGGGSYRGGTKVSGGLVSGASSKNFSCTGGVQTFTAPYTTTYTLEVWGAQGGQGTNSGAKGGTGGYATGTIDLKAGDKLYVVVGGKGQTDGGTAHVYYKGGYNGGGHAYFAEESYRKVGSGGGATHIATANRGELANYVSHRSEVLIVAGGGGGGAMNTYNGGVGGGTTGGKVTTNWDYNQITGGTQAAGGKSDVYTNYGQAIGRASGFGVGAYISKDSSAWAGAGGGGGWYGGGAGANGGAGGSGYIGGVKNGSMQSGQNAGNGKATISCSEVEAFRTTGGTNYINTSFCAKNTSTTAGSNNGTGKITLVSKTIGYYEATKQDGVATPDKASPYPIDVTMVDVILERMQGDNTNYKITFTSPADRGTAYYHKVESYLLSSEEALSVSNITTNIITTGYKGVYYYVDQKSTGSVKSTHSFSESNVLTYIGNKDKVYYLHIATVDIAGNISDTVTVKLQNSADGEIAVENFVPVTDSIGIKVSDFNDTFKVFPLYESGDIYYVKADGETNFTLPVTAHIKNNMERNDYQVNTIKYNVLMQSSDTIVEWLSGRANNGKNKMFSNAEIGIDSKSNMQFMEATYGTASRNATGALTMKLDVKFSPSAESSTLIIYPSAYAEAMKEGEPIEVSSDTADDRTKYITIITDSVAPKVAGLEELADCDSLNMTEESETFIITASDAVSGLGDFEVRIDNQDNYISRTIKDGDDGAKDGAITITVPRYMEGSTEGLEFCGDFVVTAYAVDNVGNERVESQDTAAVALVAELKRILEPHDPIFKQGESGYLSITTWGYVEKVEVEFPDALTLMNPELNMTYDYADHLQYVQEEKLQFMIPLSFPEGEYQVKVKGYKPGTNLESHPEILTFTVRGSVLDELRTRLR